MISIFLLISFPIVFSQSLYVKHKDTVMIYNLVVPKNSTFAYRDDSTFADFTPFTIEKYPYYKSQNDYIIGGRTALLIRQNTTNRYCAFDGRKRFSCLSTKPNKYTMRILGKHDKDNEPMYSQQIIKFRIPNSSIDCAATSKRSFSCIKQEEIKYYTFVLAKDTT